MLSVWTANTLFGKQLIFFNVVGSKVLPSHKELTLSQTGPGLYVFEKTGKKRNHS